MRALVTGGSRGLGRAIVQALLREGHQVSYTFRTEHSTVEGAEAVQWPVERGAPPGDFDILVNNAGITQALPFALLREEDWDLVLGTNLRGAFLTTRDVVRGMMRRKHGVVLNIGSLAGEKMIDAPVHYVASKAGLRGLTQGLARQLGRYNIRVLCLAPGLLDEGVGAAIPPHRVARYLEHCALGRLGTVREVAELAAFLVSDAASFMTGETLVVDGGL